jgi:tartrate dehydratase beta subunit/fumarate hydratase class I family protein
MYFCTTNYVTEISLEGYTCTSVQPTTSQKSVWDLQMYLCTTNCITEIRLRATNVPMYNQLHHRNQSESYKCTSVQPTTSQKSVWELHMYLCTTNYITEISLRATHVPPYNQLHHRNQSDSYKCTSVQPTTSQKLVWELQMYLCTTNYITEISLRATHVLLYN